MIKQFEAPDDSWEFWLVGNKGVRQLVDLKSTLICTKEDKSWYWYGGENPPHWGAHSGNSVCGGGYEEVNVISRDNALKLLKEQESRRTNALSSV